ncbi:MAG: hypothetical protein CMD53_00330 [Gammaproteobacteria bacterium]|nr:hypothetical protein [Gammaproteobacteria bacterium]HJL95639.1 hypothetical protein [SAR86 cluster bacterium]HJM59820.1 hypothetical protein [SAR86 cluster bacterium]|tara:strand:- start:68 stop:760 length:693 start_codon:yes stop_codon:yes gene_type:complete
MNKSKGQNNQDIKPIRSEGVSNRKKRRVKGGTMLFSTTLLLINTVGLIVLGLWFFNTSGNQQQAGLSFVERISLIEESIEAQSDAVSKLVESNELDLKFINKEIRKLWDLSNKKNRKSISTNLNSIEEIREDLEQTNKDNKTLAAKQRALTLELAKLDKIQERFKSKFDAFEPDASDELVEDRIKDLEEASKSLDLYRTQVNQSILSINKKIVALEIEISNIEYQETSID